MSNQAPVTRRLANGAELRAQQQPWAQQAGLCLRVAAGSHDEPQAYPGLAHFLEHLLFLGSRDYPVDQGLMAFVQRHGGLVNASTQARHTDFVCELPAGLLQPALMRLLDILGQPLLEIDAQVRERLVSRFDLATTEPEWALGYQFDIVLRGRNATPVEEPHEH